VVNGGINDTVANSLSHHLLSFLNALEAQFLSDISERDLGVADVDLFQAELDDSVLESMHKTEHLISLKHLLVTIYESIEPLHVTLLHEMHDLVVGEQVLRKFLLVEHLAIWNLTHE